MESDVVSGLLSIISLGIWGYTEFQGVFPSSPWSLQSEQGLKRNRGQKSVFPPVPLTEQDWKKCMKGLEQPTQYGLFAPFQKDIAWQGSENTNSLASCLGVMIL